MMTNVAGLLNAMHITHLSLTNFRNYGRLELALPAGTTLLFGANAQGKTNLLEAIYYLATTRSPYASHDSQLINWEALQGDDLIVVARLSAQVSTGRGDLRVEMRLIRENRNGNGGFRREALVNQVKVRLMDLLSNIRVVQFLPQDVQVLTGPPAGRRRYLDITLCQTDPIYCQTLATYNKVLEQRNATLRRMNEEGVGHDVLPIFTEKLVNLGSDIFRRRATFLLALAREAQRIHYEELTDGQEAIKVAYLPRISRERVDSDPAGQYDEAWEETSDWLVHSSAGAIAERFQRALQGAMSRDIAQARTSVGPHRDDWSLWVNRRELASYGSRGQQRTAMLALKLAEINWMTGETGETPILLLDEVVAELDDKRRRLLLDYVQRGAQALLTATDPGMLSDAFLAQSTNMRVERGRVQPAVILSDG